MQLELESNYCWGFTRNLTEGPLQQDECRFGKINLFVADFLIGLPVPSNKPFRLGIAMSRIDISAC